jgi:hypothetical protein
MTIIHDFILENLIIQPDWRNCVLISRAVPWPVEKKTACKKGIEQA